MRAVQMSLRNALKVRLRLGALMLRVGDTAFRLRGAMGLLAKSMGIDGLQVQIALNSMIATAWRENEQLTSAKEVAPLGINAWRIGVLDNLARSSRPGLTSARLAADLDAIEAAPALRSIVPVALA